MPFNFWFVHTTPGGHIDGISGDCDLNKQRKIKWFNVSLWSRCPTLPYIGNNMLLNMLILTCLCFYCPGSDRGHF